MGMLELLAIVVVGAVMLLMRRYGTLSLHRIVFVVAVAVMWGGAWFSGGPYNPHGQAFMVFLTLVGFAIVFGPTARKAYERRAPRS